MSAIAQLDAFLSGIPALNGWEIQYNFWHDDGKTKRYLVIKPVGGVAAELVRRPQFTITAIGAEGVDSASPHNCLEAIIEAMRSDSGTLIHLEAGEPIYMATNDGRPVFEIAVSAITD